MSIFHTARFERRFPVPFLAFEHLGHLIDQGTDQIAALHGVLVTCCGRSSPVEADYEYLLGRIESYQKVLDDKPDVDPYAPPPTPTLGHSLRNYLQDLSTEQLILVMCSGDHAAAQRLYCEVDRDDVTEMLKAFTRWQTEKHHALYEACLYAAGGHYKDDEQASSGASATDGDVVDMSDASPEDLKKLFGMATGG